MFLDALHGQRLDCVTQVEATVACLALDGSSNRFRGLQLRFADSTLTIYNPVSLQPGARFGDICDPQIQDSLSELVGTTVLALEEGDRFVRILFSGGGTLSISLSDDAYSGPEALVFWSPRGCIVV